MITVTIISSSGVQTLTDEPTTIYQKLKPMILSDEKWLFKNSQLISKNQFSEDVFTEDGVYSVTDALIGG